MYNVHNFIQDITVFNQYLKLCNKLIIYTKYANIYELFHVTLNSLVILTAFNMNFITLLVYINMYIFTSN